MDAGKFEQTRERCESPTTPLDEQDRHSCLALAYHGLSRQSDAARELQAKYALAGDDAAYDYARIHAQWGDTAAALEWLTKAERLRDPQFQTIRVDPQLDTIRSEPRFKAIEARLRIPP